MKLADTFIKTGEVTKKLEEEIPEKEKERVHLNGVLEKVMEEEKAKTTLLLHSLEEAKMKKKDVEKKIRDKNDTITSEGDKFEAVIKDKSKQLCLLIEKTDKVVEKSICVNRMPCSSINHEN